MFLRGGDALGKGSSKGQQTYYCPQEVKFSHKYLLLGIFFNLARTFFQTKSGIVIGKKKV